MEQLKTTINEGKTLITLFRYRLYSIELSNRSRIRGELVDTVYIDEGSGLETALKFKNPENGEIFYYLSARIKFMDAVDNGIFDKDESKVSTLNLEGLFDDTPTVPEKVLTNTMVRIGSGKEVVALRLNSFYRVTPTEGDPFNGKYLRTVQKAPKTTVYFLQTKKNQEVSLDLEHVSKILKI